MTEVIPLFPLQLVAFPGETVSLHVFEQRYRDLLQDMESEGLAFAIPTVIDGAMRPLATEVSLRRVVKRYPGGESDIRLTGQRILRITEFFPRLAGKSYPGGHYREQTYEREEDPARNRAIVDLTREIYAVLKIDKELPVDLTDFRTYDLAHYIGLTLEQEYEFLTLLEAEDRQDYMMSHLRQVRPDATKRVTREKRARLNGHFRTLGSPEF